MPQFAYTAIEPTSGRAHEGRIASENPWQAAQELKARGLAPLSLVAESHAKPGGDDSPAQLNPADMPVANASRARGTWRSVTQGRRLSRKGLALFTRQLAALLKAGMPLLRALEVLARSERRQAFRDVIEELAGVIRAGGNLSDGLRKFSGIFDDLYVMMIHTGEAGGSLEKVLDRLARFLERAERIRGRVKAAMTYPAIIMLVAGGILTGLMIFVVPKFQQIFSGVLKGQPLPPLTLMVIGLGEFMHHHALLVIALLGSLSAVARMVRRSHRGRRGTDWLLVKLPVLGDLFLKAMIARFARTFGSLLSSGVPMLDALTLTRATCGNLHVADALALVQGQVKEGVTVTRALETTAVFPGMVTSLIEVGEETGALPEMLGRIADAYDEEVDNAVAALTSIIEPVMIVLMALVVGVIVIALFLPIVSVVQHLQ